MGKVIYSLPTSVEVDGTEYAIQSDYRAILDILVALTDRELDERDKAEAALTHLLSRLRRNARQRLSGSPEPVLPLHRPRAGESREEKAARDHVMGAGL